MQTAADGWNLTLFAVTKETCWSWSSEFIQRENGVLTHAQPEVIEGMSVDAIQLADHGDSKFHHNPDLGLLLLFVLIEHTQSFHYEGQGKVRDFR